MNTMNNRLTESILSWTMRFLTLAWLLVPTATLAVRAPDASMAPDVDVRAPLANALPSAVAPGPSTPAQANALNALQGQAAAADAELTVRWSELTGAPSRVYSLTQALTGPSAAPALDIATEFLHGNLAVFNLSSEDISEIRVSRQVEGGYNWVTNTPAGTASITFQQQAKGIDVFGGTIDINISGDGRVLSIFGEPIPGIHGAVNTATPVLSEDEAISQAAAGAGVTNIEEARVAGLVYFPLALGNSRLAWEVIVADAMTPNNYRSLVDAVAGGVLWRQNGTRYAHIATHGAVFERDSPIPDNPSGTSTGTIARTDQLFHGGGQVFPPILGTPLFPHGDAHFDWWDGAARTVTTSNNVQAQEDRDGNNAGGTQATDNGTDDFTHGLDLTMEPDTYTLAAITNLFYWNNRLHDIWYRYGFDEASSNFQTDNLGLGGVGGDAVIADAQDNEDGGSNCNANFGTGGADGSAARMQMFQCDNATPERDGDFDNVVIAHEFHHGLGERLRPTLHTGLQGGGMGEGGGDFQGLAVIAEEGDDPNGNYEIGQYLFNSTNGIRRGFYSIRPGVYAFTYGDIPLTGSVHATGEIWANTLWIARALLISRYGFVTGTNTILQLQIDGYKLSPGNPDFLDVRDAILIADANNNDSINECLLWQAFARMGMGASASTTGNTDTTPVEAFDTPLECTPKVSVNPSLVDFGLVPVNPVGSESGLKSVDFNACNVGTSDLFVTNVVLQAANSAFTIVPPPPEGFPLPISKDFCHTIEVQCNPTASGVTSATAQIESTDPLNAVVTDPDLTCTGAVPTAQVSPNLLSFGNVPTDPVGGEVGVKDMSLKVRNQGTSNLQVTSIAAVGGDAADFTVLTPNPGFPTTISPGAEFDYQIRCNPSLAGLRSTTLRVTSNSGGVAGTTTDVAANCTGTVPDLRVTGDGTFGDVCAETTAERIIKVCNVGPSNLDVTSAAFDAACPDFTLVNNPFPAPVSPDSCVDLTIRFTPTSAGPKSCNLVINTNDPDTPTFNLPVTANTPAASIDVPPNQSFLPEVIQSIGTCTSSKPFPISNTGSCNLNITAIAIGGPDGGDYSQSGVPSFPIILEPGHVAGEGDLNTVFAPTAIDRDRIGDVTVTYVSDPVTGEVAMETGDLCGEGVRTGARVLVSAGGVPLPTVHSIKIQRLTGNVNKPTVDTVDVAKNLALVTETPGGVCPSFQFHREYGTVSNPSQLQPGSYRVTTQATVGGKKKNKTVGFDVSTCDFNPTITVNY